MPRISSGLVIDSERVAKPGLTGRRVSQTAWESQIGQPAAEWIPCFHGWQFCKSIPRLLPTLDPFRCFDGLICHAPGRRIAEEIAGEQPSFLNDVQPASRVSRGGQAGFFNQETCRHRPGRVVWIEPHVGRMRIWSEELAVPPRRLPGEAAGGPVWKRVDSGRCDLGRSSDRAVPPGRGCQFPTRSLGGSRFDSASWRLPDRRRAQPARRDALLQQRIEQPLNRPDVEGHAGDWQSLHWQDLGPR